MEKSREEKQRKKIYSSLSETDKDRFYEQLKALAIELNCYGSSVENYSFPKEAVTITDADRLRMAIFMANEDDARSMLSKLKLGVVNHVSKKGNSMIQLAQAYKNLEKLLKTSKSFKRRRGN